MNANFVTSKITGASTLVISENDGFNYISIFVDGASTSDATILGNGIFWNGTASDAADIPVGTGLSLVKQNAYNFAFTLTIPSGCIVDFVAY